MRIDDIAARFLRLLRVALALLLAGGPIAVVGPAGAGSVAVGARWRPWHPDVGPYDCASVQVPLDYDAPSAGAISLALIRLRAPGSPDARIGSLFVNPGGPGVSG